MNTKWCLIAIMLMTLVLATACEKETAESGGKGSGNQKATADASGRCPHEIKQDKCPFCNPKLIESEGFCGEHGVDEALCVQCRPYLKAAFRAKGDWCKEHNTPDSQCVDCHPALKEKMKAGAGHGVNASASGADTKAVAAGDCEHGIPKAKCPFCTPSRIESEGHCKEHDIAEALCVKCHSYLETAFKAKGDWCKEHDTPESQCVECHPDLKNKPKGDR